MAMFALIKTAARLPAFRSNLELLVESTSSLTARVADSGSWIGKSNENNWIAWSTADVMGGGGNGQALRALEGRDSQRVRGSCSQDPRIGLVSCGMPSQLQGK